MLVRLRNCSLGYLEREVEGLYAGIKRYIEVIKARRELLDKEEARVRREEDKRIEKLRGDIIEGLLRII